MAGLVGAWNFVGADSCWLEGVKGLHLMPWVFDDIRMVFDASGQLWSK